VYAAHSLDRVIRYRVTENPGDPSAWTPERRFEPVFTTRDHVCYSNLHALRDEGARLYNFFRGNHFDPNVAVSDDHGETWEHVGRLLGGPGRPYVRYAGNGTDSIHFTCTDQHPRDADNSLYHGFLRGGIVHRSDGEAVGPVDHENPPSPHELTEVFAGTPDAVAWCADIALDRQERPVIVYTVQQDSAGLPRGRGGDDHRFRYARFDGAQWIDHPLAYAGKRLYAAATPRERVSDAGSRIHPPRAPARSDPPPRFALRRTRTSPYLGVAFAARGWSATYRPTDPPTTDLRPPTSDLRPPTSDCRFWMERVERPSPTLGAPPPEGAVVLLGPGMTDLSQTWKVAGSGNRAPGWAMVEDGTMQVVPRTGSLISTQEFGDAQIHVEFRIPLMAEESGQGRGNSGVYIQDRYEIQILDSYGVEARDNDCGGIYQLAAPRVNMARPPMQWQTYDIDFTAPRIDSDGSAAANARVTVRHNGVLIHDDLELPHPTGSARSKGIIARAGLNLQDHGDPVAFRNIWVVDRSAP
jgi:hypothetical protein